MSDKPQTIDAFLRMIGCYEHDEVWGVVRALSADGIRLLHSAVAKAMNAAWDKGYKEGEERPLPEMREERRIPPVADSPVDHYQGG